MMSCDLGLMGLSQKFASGIQNPIMVSKHVEISNGKNAHQKFQPGRIYRPKRCPRRINEDTCDKDLVKNSSNNEQTDLKAYSRPVTTPVKATQWYINRTTSFVMLLQVVCLGIFVTYVEYAPMADSGDLQNSIDPLFGGHKHQNLPIDLLEFFLVTTFVCVILPVGELKNYKQQKFLSFVLFVFISLEWALACDAILQLSLQSIAEVSIRRIIKCELTTLSICLASIQFVGRVDMLQLLIFQVLIVPIQIFNSYFIQEYLLVFDPSETICVHLFGSLNGFICLMILTRRCGVTKRTSEVNYFHLIQTLLLLVLWPGLTIGNLSASAQRRTIINSVITSISALVMSYPFSVMFSPSRHFEITALKNSVISANVMVGSVSPLMLQSYGAVIVGWLASFVTVSGNYFINMLLIRRFKLYDAASILINHGLAGLFGGILTSILAAMASPDMEQYGYSLYQLYKARSPQASSLDFKDVSAYLLLSPGQGRSASAQAVYQLLAVICTISVAALSGLLMGGVLNLNYISTKPHTETVQTVLNVAERNAARKSSVN